MNNSKQKILHIDLARREAKPATAKIEPPMTAKERWHRRLVNWWLDNCAEVE